MAKDEKNKKSKKVNEQKKSFLKESRAELKKVSWPKPKSLFTDTATVIGIVLTVAIIVVILDSIFAILNNKVLLKAEEKVKNTTSVVTNVENVNNNETNENNAEENNNQSENAETNNNDAK